MKAQGKCRLNPDNLVIRPERFFDTPPFYFAKHYARKYGCDLTIPNGSGIGNVLAFTPLVVEYARKHGKRLKILTGRINPWVGVVKGECKFPIWQNNPYISEIVDADEIDSEIMKKVVLESDNYCQFGHIIENICLCYKLRPRELKPVVFLSSEEMAWGFQTLSYLARPVVCLHPSGTSSSNTDSPWFFQNWMKLIDRLQGKVSFVQLGKRDDDYKELGIFSPHTTLREAMAIIWACDMTVGFDNGLAHIATAFRKPAIVLWDAVRKSKLESEKHPGFASATMMRWSYPQNRNLLILEEKGEELVQLCCNEILNLLRSNNAISECASQTS